MANEIHGILPGCQVELVADPISRGCSFLRKSKRRPAAERFTLTHVQREPRPFSALVRVSEI